MASNQLTAAKLRTKVPGRHTDGGGLMLLVKPGGARSWVLRVMVKGERRDIGLGSVDIDRQPGPATDALEALPIGRRKMLTLAEAREKAAEARRLLKAGLNPSSIWEKEAVVVPTFKAKAEEHWKAELAAGTWRNGKHREEWLSSLKRHAFGVLGNLLVSDIDAGDIAKALKPIWLTKPETADRVQQRICAVLTAAKVAKQRKESAPSIKEIKEGLPKRSDTNSRQEEHFAAMEYDELPELIRKVRSQPVTTARLGMLFNFYTCVRPGELRNVKWGDVDLEGAKWTIPPPKAKKGRAHVVPLSKSALAVLQQAGELFGTKSDAFVFPGVKRGKPMSDGTVLKAFKADGGMGFTVHGTCRSGFRDWCGETQTTVPAAVAEAVLSHKVKDKTERAYHRTVYFEQRKPLMEVWAQFLDGAYGVGATNVAALKAAGA